MVVLKEFISVFLMFFKKTIALAITGASGAGYALTLLEQLLQAECRVYLMVTQAGQIVLNMETDHHFSAQPKILQEELIQYYQAQAGQLFVFGRQQWLAPVASGTNPPDAMVVCPCTTGALSAISVGASNNLMERAADVMLKERKKLILVVRETPLSEIHLENMLKLSRMGVVIMPASPGFYENPTQLQDLIDFMVARILDHLAVPQQLIKPWGKV